MFIILLILIFIRPFIASLAFPYLNIGYSAVLLVFLLVWTIFKGIPLFRIQPLKRPLILFCLALIISVVFSTFKLNSFIELYRYISALLLFLIITTLNHENRTRVARILVFAGLAIALFGIYQRFFGFNNVLGYLTKQNLPSSFALDYIGRKRIFFPFVTPNALGGYLAMILPLALIFKDRNWFIIPLSFVLLLTQSMGALLSLFFAVLVYFSFQGKWKKQKIILLICLILIIACVFIARMNIQKEHTKPLVSILMRLNYWKETLLVIKKSPLTGVGPGNFFIIPSDFAHNSYLQIWAEMGILGIIAFFWLIGKVLARTFEIMKKPGYKKEMALLLIANLTFLLNNVMDFSFFLPEVMLIWWVILGLLYADCALADK